MNRRQLVVVIGSLVVVWLLAREALATSPDRFNLGWHVIASGGGHSASASYFLNGSIGQLVK